MEISHRAACLRTPLHSQALSSRARCEQSYRLPRAHALTHAHARSFFPSSMSRRTSMSKSDSLHAHDLIATIDVNDLAGNGRRAIARQKNAGLAQLSRIATALQRRAFLIMLQHLAETADTARSQRLHRA